jgi:Leucine-rich repeat (LRR) protein
MISINGKMVNKDIKILNLSNNNITQLPVEIGQLTQLTELNLCNNNLTQLPVEIGHLTQLTRLYLQNNNITHLPVEIGQLTQLTTLLLCNNKLTHLPVEIGQLTQLTTLYLYNNKLTNLPAEIGQLTQLTTLYLSYNKLTYLPVEIGQLTQLTRLFLQNNNITHLPVEIGQLTQLISLHLSDNMIENILNPIIQRVIQRIEHRANRNNGNTIYTDTQNVHSSSIQQSIRDSINNLMNAFIVDYPLTYLDWSVLTQQTKEIITEYIDCNDIHTMLNITFKELFTAVVIEMDKLSPDLQIEIQKRMNEEMQDSECKCFTGRISRLVNCLSGYSDKVCIQISENEEINNIISVIMSKRELKTIEVLKEEVNLALKERGYNIDKIKEWLEYVE